MNIVHGKLEETMLKMLNERTIDVIDTAVLMASRANGGEQPTFMLVDTSQSPQFRRWCWLLLVHRRWIESDWKFLIYFA